MNEDLKIPTSISKDLEGIQQFTKAYRASSSSIALRDQSSNTNDLQKNSLRIQPTWLKDLSLEDSSVIWLLVGLIALGKTTLISGPPKSGKTTWVYHFLKSIESFIGIEKIETKTLIITEESKDIWLSRRETTQLPGDQIAILPRLFLTKPKIQEWVIALKEIVEHCKKLDIKLVIFDTISQVWPVKDENDAAQVTEALQALHLLTEAEIAILLIHHTRKGGGNDGEGVRGSSSIMGFIDIALEFSKDSENGKRRKIKFKSRFEETPEELVIELIDGEYKSLGTSVVVRWKDKKKSLLNLIPALPQCVTLKQLEGKILETGESVDTATVWRWIQRLQKEGDVQPNGRSEGKGKPILWGKIVSTTVNSQQNSGATKYFEGGY